MICSKCNGNYSDKICTKCYGKKDLDWIENIVGVETPTPTLSGVNWVGEQPDNPNCGDAYYDPANDVIYIFDGKRWVITVHNTDINPIINSNGVKIWGQKTLQKKS